MFGRANGAQHRREDFVPVNERSDVVARDKIWSEQGAGRLSKLGRARGIKRGDLVTGLLAGLERATAQEKWRGERSEDRNLQTVHNIRFIVHHRRYNHCAISSRCALSAAVNHSSRRASFPSGVRTR